MTKGKLYLIPVPIAADAAHTIPVQVHQSFELKYFVVERLKTARRMMRTIGFKGDFDQLHFQELDKHAEHIDYKALLQPASDIRPTS